MLSKKIKFGHFEYNFIYEVVNNSIPLNEIIIERTMFKCIEVADGDLTLIHKFMNSKEFLNINIIDIFA